MGSPEPARATSICVVLLMVCAGCASVRSDAPNQSVVQNAQQVDPTKVAANGVGGNSEREGVVLVRGHGCDMGGGVRLWAFHIEGHRVQSIRLELLCIAKGRAQRIASGSYGELPPKFVADVHVLGMAGRPFSEAKGKSFAMGASFTPMQRGQWQRTWPKLPVAFTLWPGEGPSDATTLEQVEISAALSTHPLLVREMELLLTVFAPDVKAWPPGFGGQAKFSVEEWEAFTKQRGEVILMARLICEDAPRKPAPGNGSR
jgi:hypothetical protein